ncbi:DNA topoisomerase 6 subunit A [Balamuthia mandrillaris]
MEKKKGTTAGTTSSLSSLIEARLRKECTEQEKQAMRRVCSWLEKRPVKSSSELIACIESTLEDARARLPEGGQVPSGPQPDLVFRFASRQTWENISFDGTSQLNRLRRDDASEMNEALPHGLTKMTCISYDSAKTRKTFVCMIRVMQLVLELLKHNVHMTKRELFYTDVSLFGNQDASDHAIEHVACLLDVPRSRLNLLASERGLVAGHVKWNEADSVVDCLQFGLTGKHVPNNVDHLTNLQTSARFILIVEDHATFTRLLSDKFIAKYSPCILITGCGSPSIAPRQFLRRLKDENPHLVVFAMVDWDVWGMEILSTYAFGSLKMSGEVESLAVPELKWIGLHSADFATWNLPSRCFLPISERDIAKGIALLKRLCFNARPFWRKEIEMMLARQVKVELQALSSIALSFLCEQYFAMKIQRGDWA